MTDGLIQNLWKRFSTGANDLLLIIGMVGVLMILFTPIDPSTLDFLLIVNFSVALLILLVTFYTERPLEFSTFPSILLMTTLFRLALNISATRLILDGAEAGEVIESVGEHVVGGNFIIGLVVFFILIVVQYVVVTNGAQRVAEVAARFILDSLPGKQMSIDADLNMGLIDQDEARKKRKELEKESNFYGAMDGASKFVKGDAIAGIIIILIDIIGGLIIGIVQLDMEWGEALHRYTLLTVGDGIVTQIPSLIIAVAAGIIITRAATDTRLANEITNQFSAHPKTLLLVGGTLLCLTLLPGIPVIPILIVAGLFIAGSIFAFRKHGKSRAGTSEQDESKAEDSSEETLDLYKMTKNQSFELILSHELAERFIDQSSELETRCGSLRQKVARKMGVIVPPISVDKDSELSAYRYRINIFGVEYAAGEIVPDALLAINSGDDSQSIGGRKTVEPTYGLPAEWIDTDKRAIAHAAGYTIVEPLTVLMTHLQEISYRYAGEFLTRQETEKLIESRRAELGSLIDELIPNILTYSDVQRILQSLLEEKVSLRSLDRVLEVLVDEGRQIKDHSQLLEKVRVKLSSAICKNISDSDGILNVLTISPNLEGRFIRTHRNDDKGEGLKPGDVEKFVARVAKEGEKMLTTNMTPVLLCAPPIRSLLYSLLHRTIPNLHVLATSEIDRGANVRSFAVVDV